MTARQRRRGRPRRRPEGDSETPRRTEGEAGREASGGDGGSRNKDGEGRPRRGRKRRPTGRPRQPGERRNRKSDDSRKTADGRSGKASDGRSGKTAEGRSPKRAGGRSGRRPDKRSDKRTGRPSDGRGSRPQTARGRRAETRPEAGELRTDGLDDLGKGLAELESEAQPQRRAKPKPRELESIESIGRTLERVLESSPADETELVWLEVRRGEATRQGNQIEASIRPERTVLVRVLDLGRVGSYRTCSGEAGDLANSVRLAVSQSRVREPLTGLPHLPGDSGEAGANGDLHDSRVSELDVAGARELLKKLPAERETLRLQWADARVVVYNSRSVRRQAAVTGVGFEARCGRSAGSGHTADAARRLEDLNPEGIIERARLRHASGDLAEVPEAGVPVLLAPEATISLIEMLNQESFSAKAYYDGTSFLREHLGVQVFDRALTLRDDGTDPSGIPFPFDLEGTLKREVPLILDGAPKTPALDQRQAAVLGLPPTAHAIGGNDARAQNVFMVPGEKSADELLAAAEGGIWIGWLDHLECREPNRVQFRTRARGVRRIENGKLGAPLPDLFWEDSLLRAFSAIVGIGNETARRLTRDGYLGGFSAPAVVLGGVEGLRTT
jgi:predicted Zn-dependent protease